jgi:1-acyl-sn-glycerol-3-phosphate acyltransferase
MLLRGLLQVLVIPPATLLLGAAVILLCPLDAGGRVFPRLARAWARVVLGVSGIRVARSGVEAATAPAVFVANHISLLDPPALLLAVPANLRFVAKQSLFYIPIFGQALWAAGIIPIRRGDRARAIASMDRAAGRLRRGQSVLVFAEGTRSADGRLRPLKKGAFVMALGAGAPVQPVLISGSRDLLPPGSLLPRPGTIRVELLPPVATDGLEPGDRDRLREQVAARLRDRQESATARAAI